MCPVLYPRRAQRQNGPSEFEAKDDIVRRYSVEQHRHRDLQYSQKTDMRKVPIDM